MASGSQGWGEVGITGSECLMETEFQFEKEKKSLELDSGDDCTTNATKVYTYKELRW